ncbi:MAG: protein-disulfide reductase DsbD [Gammaproteobacteria bacterium]|nr:protein-disulfide reductase DsbD [Gammaproteobacteria bacterium]
MHQQITQKTFLHLLFGTLLSLIAITATAQGITTTPQSSPSLQSLLGQGGEDSIIPPEQAYQFSAQVESPEQLRLKWVIANGTYLYQEKIRLKLKQADGVVLGKYQLPPAKIKKDALRPDGSTGDLPVYYYGIDLSLPLVRSNTNATTITLEAVYQGCADLGVCYPPQTRELTLELPATSAAAATISPITAAAAPDSSTETISEQDRIIASLSGGNYWLVITIFFGFGLALSLTPCIFPMVPILSGIIVGQGKEITTARAFSLSLVYVMAMAITYTIAGVLAGLFGENLQAAFQNPWILGVFAGVFVFLAISMFGFFDLQLPSSLQSRLAEISNRQQGGTLIGAGIMGFLSALIVGPCVAPPLAAALIFIGQTGDGLLGGIALFSLSMGMGSPLIAIGTSAGKLLPRVGSWMDIVKGVFGVGMLAVAIIMLERIIPATVAMVLWGTLLMVSAIYMGALHELPIEASGWQRLWKGLGVVMLVYGSLMLVGAAAGGKDTVQPLRGISLASSTAQPQHLNFKRIKSVDDLDREVAAANGRPVMLDFAADWCVTCKEMERYTFSDPAVIAALDGFVLLQADVTANDKTDKALLQGRFGMPGPPSIMFFDRNGKERENFRVVGFVPADEFVNHVTKAAK